MAEFLEASGRIAHLTNEEKSWLEAQKDVELFATIVQAGDTDSTDGNVTDVAQGAEFDLTFTSVPQDEQVAVVQEFFKRFRPLECVTITWACESGPYRGGGACLISATEDKWNHTGNWAKEQEEEFYRRQGSTSKGK
jgi:hypothetical protein